PRPVRARPRRRGARPRPGRPAGRRGSPRCRAPRPRPATTPSPGGGPVSRAVVAGDFALDVLEGADGGAAPAAVFVLGLDHLVDVVELQLGLELGRAGRA